MMARQSNTPRAISIALGWVMLALISALLLHAALLASGTAAYILGLFGGCSLSLLICQVLVWHLKGFVLPPQINWVLVVALSFPWLMYTVWPFPG